MLVKERVGIPGIVKRARRQKAALLALFLCELARGTGAAENVMPIRESGGRLDGFPSLDLGTLPPQLACLALTFGLIYLCYLFSRGSLPRVGTVKERVRGSEHDLELSHKLKSANPLAGFEQALADARAEVSGLAKTMRTTIAAEWDEERARVEMQIAISLAEAESRIAATKAEALAAVGEIAEDIADAMVTRLIGPEVTSEEIRGAHIQHAGE
jgi:F-type H+-transporting ATPase subunit b